MNLNTLSLKHVVPSDDRVVWAVTSLGDEVFVTRYSSIDIVSVYDAGTLSLPRSITVPGLSQCVYGLIACVINRCLYASDYDNSCIHLSLIHI